jgi:hypothetical protein
MQSDESLQPRWSGARDTFDTMFNWTWFVKLRPHLKKLGEIPLLDPECDFSNYFERTALLILIIEFTKLYSLHH